MDVTIIKALENKMFHKNDFIRTEDYFIRIRPKGVNKLITELDKAFTGTVKYRNKNQQWGNIIQIKTQELSNYLVGKKKDLDFSSPKVKLERVDSQDLREKILNLSYTKWKEMGFSKGTLHYMKQNARSDKLFSLNGHVKQRLQLLE